MSWQKKSAVKKDQCMILPAPGHILNLWLYSSFDLAGNSWEISPYMELEIEETDIF